MKRSSFVAKILCLALWALPGCSSDNTSDPPPSPKVYSWAERSVGSPTDLFGSVMASDAISKRILLFGGNSLWGIGNETWMWDGSNWSLLDLAPIPPPRWLSAMAHDLARNQFLLYGGIGLNAYLGDMWLFDGFKWEKQPGLAVSPGVRVSHGMAYDAERHQVILFGGVTGGSYLALNDTWVWDGSQWEEKTDVPVKPPARTMPGIAFDAARGQVVLFGGQDNDFVPLNDTWVWTGQAWEEKTGLTPIPEGRTGPAMAYDEKTQRMVLFGGWGQGGRLNDTWAWDGQKWELLMAPEEVPQARDMHVMAYDRFNEQVMMIGGGEKTADYPFFETWALADAGWRVADHVPVPRRYHAAAFDVKRGQMVVFGGVYGQDISNRILGDTWLWNGSVWVQQTGLETAPRARFGHAMAFDEDRGQTVVFGGTADDGSEPDDTWLWGGTAWEEKGGLPTRPFSVALPAMAYDPVRKEMVMFGGSHLGQDQDTTWTWNGSIWIEKSDLPVKPTPRHGAAMAFDRGTGQMMMFGGVHNHVVLSDTWVWNGETWKEITGLEQQPEARRFHAMAGDSYKRNVVLFAGVWNDGEPANDTWVWQEGTWFKPANQGSDPPTRAALSMVYDTSRKKTVAFGGLGGDLNTFFNDVWEFEQKGAD